MNTCPTCQKPNVIDGREYAQEDHWRNAYPRGRHTPELCAAFLNLRNTYAQEKADHDYELHICGAVQNVIQHYVSMIGRDRLNEILRVRYTTAA